MELPVFIDTNAEQIIAEMVSDYEAMTGRTLQPAQAERLLINAFAYREYLLRTQINEAARLNLVEFSRAPYLDYLGELVGVRRLTASAAVCRMKLTLVEGHGALTIPAGVRIQTIDGLAVFSLDGDTIVDADVLIVEVTATCLTEGKVGNGYEPDSVVIILDPQPYLVEATNLDKTGGGADAESDDELRERIKLAPQSFSNAGSTGAYKYFARSANPGIIDVSVTSPIPGQVNIYPLMENGELPSSEVLAQVYNTCNAEKVRPLTDTVIVLAPTPITYSISVELTLISGSAPTDVEPLVTAALQDYTDSRKLRCGLDVVKDRIIKISMIDSVYSVNVLSPVSDLVVANDEVAQCTGITVTTIGHSDE